jgi:hypothetical protein
MRVLTIRQPWASLIVVAGLKDVENRTWPTSHRGPLAIHAGASPDKTATPEDWAAIAAFGDRPVGAIIGIVDVVDCVQGYDSPYALGGFWHWVLENPRALPEAIPAKGRLGLWTFDDAALGLGSEA